MSNFTDLVNDKSLQNSVADIAVASNDDDGIATYADDTGVTKNLPSGFTKSKIASHVWHDEYDDTSYSIVDEVTKKVTVDKKQINITQEQNSQFIPFKMARYYDGIDLSEMLITIHFVNVNGDDYTTTAVNVCYSDTELRFAWLVNEYATAVAGDLLFEIVATGTKDGLTYVLRTQPNDSLTVIQSLTGTNTISPTYGWENYISIITQSVVSAEEHMNNSKTYANNSASSATASANSANASANSAIKSAGSATESANSASASAKSASASATSATNSANSATASQKSATNSANSASASANSATDSANSASAAKTSENKAADYADNALTSETKAAKSATAAAVSQAAAETGAKEAASSAVEALTSAAKAATSEQNANTYMTNAKSSQTAAANSATEAQKNATDLGNKIDTVEADMTKEVEAAIRADIQKSYYTKDDITKLLDNLETATFSVVGETLVIKTK